MEFMRVLKQEIEQLDKATLTWNRNINSVIEIKRGDRRVTLKAVMHGGYSIFHVTVIEQNQEIANGIVEIEKDRVKRYKRRMTIERRTNAERTFENRNMENEKEEEISLPNCENKKKLITILEFGEWLYMSEGNNQTIFGEMNEFEWNNIMYSFLEKDLRFYRAKIGMVIQEKYIKNTYYTPQVPHMYKRRGSDLIIIPWLKKSMIGAKPIDLNDYSDNHQFSELLKKEVVEGYYIGDRERMKRLLVYMTVNYELFLQLGHKTATKIVTKQEIIDSFYLPVAKQVACELLKEEHIDENLESIIEIQEGILKQRTSMRRIGTENNKIKLT